MRFAAEASPRPSVPNPRPDAVSASIHRRRSRDVALIILHLVLCLGVLLPSSVSAENSPARKLGRGVTNLSLGFMAIPAEIIDTTRESGPTVGVTWGLIKGTGMMVATEAVGLWEVFTCPFATPPDYTPILEPEFPWQRFMNREAESSGRKVRTATAGGRRVRE